VSPVDDGAVESQAPVFMSFSKGPVAFEVLHEATEVQVEAPLAMMQEVGETLRVPEETRFAVHERLLGPTHAPLLQVNCTEPLYPEAVFVSVTVPPLG
jgi:hypothetical protein